MSTYLSAHTPASDIPGQSWTSSLLAAAKRWWIAYINWRIEQAAISQLCAMSDRELKDIGVNPADILRAARIGAPGRPFTR